MNDRWESMLAQLVGAPLPELPAVPDRAVTRHVRRDQTVRVEVSEAKVAAETFENPATARHRLRARGMRGFTTRARARGTGAC